MLVIRKKHDVWFTMTRVLCVHVEVHKQFQATPESRCVREAACDQQLVARGQEDWEAAQILRNLRLVYTDLVKPESRRAPMLLLKKSAVVTDGLPLEVSVVAPAVTQ